MPIGMASCNLSKLGATSKSDSTLSRVDQRSRVILVDCGHVGPWYETYTTKPLTFDMIYLQHAFEFPIHLAILASIMR